MNSNNIGSDKIISWDIGTKHLCYCLMDENDIYGWEIINLTKEKNKETSITHKKTTKRKKGKNKQTPSDILNLHKIMCMELDSRSEILDGVHTVIIENQMMTNQKMKTVAAALYQYYVIRGMVDNQVLKNIVYIRPTEKMKVYDGEPMVCPRKTKQNKWLAIEHCRYILNQRHKKFTGGCDNSRSHQKWIDLYTNSKKKDDLADSYLSGLAYLNKVGNQSM